MILDNYIYIQDGKKSSINISNFDNKEVDSLDMVYVTVVYI